MPTFAFRFSEDGKHFRQMASGLTETDVHEQVAAVVKTQTGRGREPQVTTPTYESLPGRLITEIRLLKPAEREHFAWQFIDEKDED